MRNETIPTETHAPTELYTHPDGWTISHGNGELIAADGDSNVLAIPIGKAGLLELSKKLYAIAMQDRNG